MAGSFSFFRTYQRSLLVFVAILAMLAFFVLPPFLQMGNDYGGGDPLVADWTGGEIREGGIERAVAMRSIVNRFLMEIAATAGRDPAQLPLFPETEEQVVRTLLFAKEAAANGLTISDTAINDFLSLWTNNLVRPEQFDEIISRLRLGPTAVSQHDLFEALRSELAARNMLILFQTGFSGDPPGWRWDYFRQLKQNATIEVVPVIVEKSADNVPLPSEQKLRAFFEKYKNDLPEASSAEPGFREPHRVKYQFLVAKAESFQADAAKDVTDEQISEYYEKNKATLYRVKEPEGKKAENPDAQKPAATDAGVTEADASVDTKKLAEPDSTPTAPAIDTPSNDTPSNDKPSNDKPSNDKPSNDKGAQSSRRPFTTVAINQPAEQSETPDTPAVNPSETSLQPGVPAESSEKFEPLQSVKESIREQLARLQANKKSDAVFTAVAADLTLYAEDFALWQARRTAGSEAPKMPDFDAIAKAQGLEAGLSELVTPGEAINAGPVGGSFEFVPDPGSRFGIRQQRWLEMIYGSGSMVLRPITSRDVQGNRYLTIKIEDQPEFTPSFEAARKGVERAWQIIEARGTARKRAEEITEEARAKNQSLEATVAKRSDVKVKQVGPFTWLSQSASPMERPPFITQPDDLFIPGEEFMRSVFGLTANQTAVAFNEPQTICYAVRLLSMTPPDTELRERFLDARSDQQSLAMVAQGEFSAAFGEWVEGLEKRYKLDWKRPPQIPGR